MTVIILETQESETYHKHNLLVEEWVTLYKLSLWEMPRRRQEIKTERNDFLSVSQIL